MHLINAKTKKLEYFVGDRIPPYAILSHTWGSAEVSMQDLISDPNVESRAGYSKIRHACRQAISDGWQYAWVDTCCIDKTSSAELSEAINSMYGWYERAEVCYAYLSDVSAHQNDSPGHLVPNTIWQLQRSRWFTRGWCLQELIAPSEVVFFEKDWRELGKLTHTLLEYIAHITSVDIEILDGGYETRARLSFMSVAKRMSWAANRQTTRKEDEAYCLIGIFGVNMPMLYGEGEAAFIRLQEEIIRTSTDHSIFAWQATDSADLLALSPMAFKGCGKVETTRTAPSRDSYAMTNAGLRITLPLLSVDWRRSHALLDCEDNGKRIAISVVPTSLVGIPTPENERQKRYNEDAYSLTKSHAAPRLRYLYAHRGREWGKKTELMITRHSISQLERKPSRDRSGQCLHLVVESQRNMLTLKQQYPFERWDVFDSGVERKAGYFFVAARFLVQPSQLLGGVSLQYSAEKDIVVCFRCSYDGAEPREPQLSLSLMHKPDLDNCCNRLMPSHGLWTAYDDAGNAGLPPVREQLGYGPNQAITATLTAVDMPSSPTGYDYVLRVRRESIFA